MQLLKKIDNNHFSFDNRAKVDANSSDYCGLLNWQYHQNFTMVLVRLCVKFGINIMYKIYAEVKETIHRNYSDCGKKCKIWIKPSLEDCGSYM